jgi:hypothetical protein
VSGKYFKKSIRLSPSFYQPISLFIGEIKEKEDIAHIMRILRINKGLMTDPIQAPSSTSEALPRQAVASDRNVPSSVVISRFNSSWTPNISRNAFVQVLKHSSLVSLLLDGNQIDHNVLKELPSFGQQLEKLEKLVFQNFRTISCLNFFKFSDLLDQNGLYFSFSANLTVEEVKVITSKSQRLQKLVINHCPNIKPNDLKDFKPSKFECD